MPPLMTHKLRQWRRHLDAEQRRMGRRYVSASLVAGATLSLAALAAVTAVAGWRPVWHGLVAADWPWLVAAPLSVFVSHMGYTLAYREVTRAAGGPHLAREQAVAMVTTGFGPLSPRGGFAVDAVALRNLGLPKEDAARMVRALGMLEYAVLAPVTLAAAAYMLAAGEPAQAGVLPSWVIGVPAGTAVAVALLIRYRRSGRPTTWWSPLRHALAAMETTLGILRSGPSGARAIVGMVVYWAADIGALAGCAVVFTHRHHAGLALVVGYSTGYALTRRSLPIAGAGVVEALLPFALTWVGYPLAEAILTVIAYRAFNLWMAVLPAIAGLRRLRELGRRPPRRSRSRVKPAAV